MEYFLIFGELMSTVLVIDESRYLALVYATDSCTCLLKSMSLMRTSCFFCVINPSAEPTLYQAGPPGADTGAGGLHPRPWPQ